MRNEPFYPISQIYENGTFAYTAHSALKLYTVSSELKAKPDQTPCSSVLVTPREFAVRDMKLDSPDKSPRQVFADVEAMVAGLIGGDSDAKSSIISLYSMLTYSSALFESLPVLWLHVPNVDARQRLTALLETVCFTGVLLYPYYPSDIVLEAIARHRPTLILPDVGHHRKGIVETLIRYANTTERAFYSEKGEKHQLYCPKIVLSDTYPVRTSWSHTLTVSCRSAESASDMDNPAIISLRTAVMKAMLTLAPELMRANTDINGLSNRTDKSFPLIALLRVLGMDTAEDVKGAAAKKYLEGSRLAPKRHTVRGETEDVLFGVSEYIQIILKGESRGKLIGIGEITKFLVDNYDMMNGINERTVSQRLNEIPRLILKRRRRQLNDAAGTPHALTCIEIDDAVLRDNLPT